MPARTPSVAATAPPRPSLRRCDTDCGSGSAGHTSKPLAPRPAPVDPRPHQDDSAHGLHFLGARCRSHPSLPRRQRRGIRRRRRRRSWRKPRPRLWTILRSVLLLTVRLLPLRRVLGVRQIRVVRQKRIASRFVEAPNGWERVSDKCHAKAAIRRTARPS